MSDKKTSIYKAFKTIIWPRRNLVLIGLLLIIISKGASFVAPLSLKYLMDDIIPNKDMEFLKILVLLVILAILVQSVTSFLLTRILSVQAQFMISELRAQVQKQVLSLPIRFFDNTKSGELGVAYHDRCGRGTEPDRYRSCSTCRWKCYSNSFIHLIDRHQPEYDPVCAYSPGHFCSNCIEGL